MFGSTGTTPPPSADFFDAFAYTMDFPNSQSFQYQQQDGDGISNVAITRMDCEQTDQMSRGQADMGCAPPTPEILSSFFNYAASIQEQEQQQQQQQQQQPQQHHQQHQHQESEVMSESQMYAGPSSSTNNCVYSSDISSSSTFSDFPPTPSPGGHSSGLSVTSPVFGQSRKVDSVKATRSQIIKEGLKLTIQHKRRARGLDSPSPQALFACSTSPDYSKDEFFGQLTPEDEDRRRRRRERNKIAATKCRNKKKERTVRLAVESTTLESSNQQLKEEIEKLEDEKKSLLHLLRQHIPRCGQMASPQPRSSCGHSATNHCAPL